MIFIKVTIKNERRLFSDAAKQGNVDAVVLLGCCYANGDGVKQDYNKAIARELPKEICMPEVPWQI